MNRRVSTVPLLVGFIVTAFCLGWIMSPLQPLARGPELHQTVKARVARIGSPIVLVDGWRCVIVQERYRDGGIAWRCPVLERSGHDGSYSMGPYEFHGVWSAYHRNGVAREVGAYKAGAKHGIWRRWDEQGRLVAEELWQAGHRLTPG